MRTRLMIAASLAAFTPALAQQPAPTPPPAPVQAAQDPDIIAANEALQNEDWPKAEKLFRAVIAKGNSARILHFRLGYALHMQKKYEEALKWHLSGSQINNRAIRIDALYNCACAHALLGHKDDALKFFQYAIDAGFTDNAQAEKDTDLDSLRSDDRFKKLVEGLGKTPRLDQQLDFLLGSWFTANEAGEAQQINTFHRPLPGSQAIATTIKNGNVSRTGLLFPNPADRTWTWTAADGIGTTLTLTGKALDSGGVQFEGRERSIGGEGVKIRLTWTESDGGVTEKVEVSEDGSTWKLHHETKFKKQSAEVSAGTQ